MTYRRPFPASFTVRGDPNNWRGREGIPGIHSRRENDGNFLPIRVQSLILETFDIDLYLCDIICTVLANSFAQETLPSPIGSDVRMTSRVEVHLMPGYSECNVSAAARARARPLT